MKSYQKILTKMFVLSILFVPTNIGALEKKESVYTYLDQTGKPYKTVVNNHLYTSEVGEIKDKTELQNIINLNGNEKFQLQNNNLIWQGKGKDIFYQGTLDKNTILSVEATYYLDGKKVNPNKIIGKKGKIKLSLSFKNNAVVKKGNETLYTPVVAIVSTILDDQNNKNIQISNGKVIDTGMKSIVVAVASPGLYEDMNIKEFESLNHITLTYDTNNFHLGNIYTVATPKILEESDFALFDKIDMINGSINKLSSSMDEIEAGTSKLLSGSKTLSSGTSTLTKNLKEVNEALEKLESGSISLEQGLNQVISALDNAKQQFNSQDITSSLTSLQTLKQQNDNAMMKLSETNQSLYQTYTEYGLANFKSEQELITYFKNLGVDDASIQNLVVCKKTYEGNLNLITLLSYNNEAINQTINSFTKISSQFSTLITELSNALEKLQIGSNTLHQGLSKTKIGASKIYDGSVMLSKGANELENGLDIMMTGTSKLNNEGIKVLKQYSNLASQYKDKLEEIIQLGNEYSGYSSNNVDKTVFIYKMNATK